MTATSPVNATSSSFSTVTPATAPSDNATLVAIGALQQLPPMHRTTTVIDLNALDAPSEEGKAAPSAQKRISKYFPFTGECAFNGRELVRVPLGSHKINFDTESLRIANNPDTSVVENNQQEPTDTEYCGYECKGNSPKAGRDEDLRAEINQCLGRDIDREIEADDFAAVMDYIPSNQVLYNCNQYLPLDKPLPSL